MRHLHTATHPDIEKLSNHSILQRKAARAIALEGEEILLLYTERYHDYTLPGGGLTNRRMSFKPWCVNYEKKRGQIISR